MCNVWFLGEMKIDDDSSVDQHFEVFKDFDFLDNELDDMEVSSNLIWFDLISLKGTLYIHVHV